MRDNDGRRLDHKALEVLRLRAVAQIQAGAHPEEVAAALGMARGTVYGWVAKYREGGPPVPAARRASVMYHDRHWREPPPGEASNDGVGYPSVEPGQPIRERH